MAINTKTPVRLLEAPLDIQLPDWLEAADREFKAGNAQDLPTHILDLLLLHQRAIGGCVESAFEIAQRYERGEVPDGPSLELAVDLEVLRQCRSPREINRVGRMMIEDRLVHSRKHDLRM